jgi:hypothetical protein
MSCCCTCDCTVSCSLPLQLHATLTDNSGTCPCLNGVTVVLTIAKPGCTVYAGTKTITCEGHTFAVCVDLGCASNPGVINLGCGDSPDTCALRSAACSTCNCLPAVEFVATFNVILAATCLCTDIANVTVTITV